MAISCRRLARTLPLLLGIAQSAAAADRSCPIPTCDARLIGYRTLVASRLQTAPRIDGHPDEAAWDSAPAATDFIQARPTPGAAALLRTEARVLVDDAALYVGVWMHDDHPAGIMAPYLRRDNEGQSDWIFVEIDSRHDRRSAFSFGLNPRGVQVDGAFADDVSFDAAWNGIWQGAAQIDAQGWTAEFRIPLSQLAFDDGDQSGDTTWGFNLYRYSPQHGEVSNWSPRFAGLSGVVSQFNELRLTLGRSPHRLDVTPFVAPRVERSPGRGDQTLIGGADLNVGLGSSFGLAATVFPDFGQVEADPSQINLTTFELFQTERRPFFVEGAGAFRFDAGLNFVTRETSFLEETPFYSRRVGRPPQGRIDPGQTTVDRPEATTILGAAKLSGRTRRGWTIGAFTAVTGRESAGVTEGGAATEVPVEPAALTNVVRVSRSLRGSETAIGAVAGTVNRFRLDRPLDDQIPSGAAVGGVDGYHRFSRQRYELQGWFLASHVAGTPQAIARIAADPRHGFLRPDAPVPAGALGGVLNGSAGQLRLSKVAGSWLWGLAGEAVSRGFELNEIGFQRQADWRILKADWRHERVPASGAVRRWTFGSENLGAGWTTGGDPRARVVDGFVRAEFRNYWDGSATWTRDFPALSTEWLRGGPALLLPARDMLHLVVNSDQRSGRFVATFDSSAAREPGSGSWLMSFNPRVTVRTSDRLEWALGPSYSDQTVGWQFLTGRGGADRASLVARVRQQTLSFTTRADLVFNVRALLQVYAQPFVSVGGYDRYQRLVSPRAADAGDRFAPIAPGEIAYDAAIDRLVVRVGPADAAPLTFAMPDAARRAMNATIVFRWEYRPGSFLTAVWNRRQDAVTVGRASLSDGIDRFNLRDATNVFLVKTSLRIGR